MTQNGRKAPVERALELFVYAPVGIALYLRDAAPMIRAMLVNRGRNAVEHRQEQVAGTLTHLRNAGDVAIAFRAPEIHREAAKRLSDLRSHVDEVVLRRPRRDSVPVAPPDDVPATAAAAAQGNGAASAASAGTAVDTAPAAAASTLPIPGYDQLSASQVVERLAGLSADELAAVRDYEQGHRGRKTILGRIDQLAP